MDDFMKAHDKAVLQQGIEQGIMALIIDNLEDGKTEEVIISKRLLSPKEPLAKQAALLYNLIRKHRN